jgi:hypothetical protein
MIGRVPGIKRTEVQGTTISPGNQAPEAVKASYERAGGLLAVQAPFEASIGAFMELALSQESHVHPERDGQALGSEFGRGWSLAGTSM